MKEEKISLGIDARVLFRKNIRGMGRYLKNIIEMAPEDFDVVLYSEGEGREFLDIEIPHHVEVKCFSLRGYRYQLWEQMGIPFYSYTKGHDILFHPASTASFLGRKGKVVTLHDSQMWRDKNYPSLLRWYYVHLLPRAFKRADVIITISHTARKEIEETFPFLTSKMRVIYHGIDPVFRPEISWNKGLLNKFLDKDQIPSLPFVLYIGGFSTKKQPGFALELFKGAREVFPLLNLVVVGLEEDRKKDFLEMAREGFGIKSGIFIMPSLPDEFLAMLYSNARVVLYPTLHEGFGFPLLEAFSSKVPILAGRAGSLPEISGGNGILLAPTERKKWHDKLIDILRNGVSSSSLDKAYLWSRRFSWERCAKQTYESLREVYFLKKGKGLCP